MSLRKVFRMLMLCAPAMAFGQTPDLPPQNEAAGPAPMPHPVSARSAQPPANGSSELQSFLDPQSEMDRRRMLDRQQRTFQLEIDGRYAKALKAYCDTGYGDERCFRPELSKAAPLPLPVPAAGGNSVPSTSSPSTSHIAPTEAHELPTVAQISGFGDDLAAILVFPGGKRLRVQGPGLTGPRSQLPGGESVISIHPGEVLVSRPGDTKPVPLLFLAAVGLGGFE